MKSISDFRFHRFFPFGRAAALAAAVCLAAAGLGTAAGPAETAFAATVKKVKRVDSGANSFAFAGTGMYTYQNLQSDLTLLSQKYSGVSVSSIGTTADGRSIYTLTLGNSGASKKILAVGGMHGREYITTPLLMRQARDLLDRRAGGDTSLDSVCVVFVPQLNPDGTAISQYGVSGMQTDTMKQKVNDIINSWADWGLLTDQDKYDWYLNKWKTNGNGVDINQNFETPTWADVDDLRNKPSSELYKGPSAGSEVETKAIENLVNSGGFTEVINFHAQGECIYWQNTGVSESVQSRNQTLARIAQIDTGYSLVGGGLTEEGAADSTEEGSSFKDWLDCQKGIPNITLEVGLGTSPVPEDQIETIWQQNQMLLPDLISELLGTYQFPAETTETAAAETSAADSAVAAETSAAASETGTAVTAAPGDTAGTSVVVGEVPQ